MAVAGGLTADLIPAGLPSRVFGNDVAGRIGRPGNGRLDGNRERHHGPRIAFTTDSFVVRPLFFPGGDIGKLAVHGTVNDLAVGGATPLFLSAAFILEEGLAADRSASASSPRCDRPATRPASRW